MESQTDSGPKFLNSNDWLSIIFQNSQDLIWCINLDFALVFGNEAFQNHTELFTGYRLKPGESVFHYLKDSEVKSEWEGYYRQVINEGKTLQIDIRTRKLPQTRYINYTLAPVLNNAVEIMGVSVIGRDVTQYKKCSEEALKANELLKLTEKLVLSGSWEYFPEDGTLNWSEQVYALHDLQPEDFEGHTQDLLYASVQCYRPEDRPRLLEAFDRCLSEGLPYDLEFSFQTQKGKPIWIRTIGVPEIKNEKVIKVKGIIKDITLHKNKDRALRSSEMKFRQLVEQAAEMLFLHDMKGNIVDVNKASVQQTGYNREELLQLSVFDIDPDAASRLDSENIWNTLAPLAEKAFEVRHRRKDGTFYPAEVNASKVIIEDQEFIIALVKDITERKKAECELKESEAMIRNLIDSMQDGLSVTDLTGVHLKVNATLIKMTGFQEDELLGVGPPHPYWPEEEFETIQTKWKDVLKGLFSSVELVFQRKNGDRFPVIVSPFALKNSTGELIGYAATLKDISARKEMEKALQDSEQRAHALINAIPDLMFRMNRHGVYTDYKAANENLLYQADSILGKNNRDITPGWFADLVQEKINKALSTRELQEFEYQLNLETLGLREYEARMVPSGSDEVIAIVRDITDRKTTERALAEAEANARAIMEATSDILILLDESGKILDNNEAHASRYGHSKTEMVGKSVFEILPYDLARSRKKLIDKVTTSGLPENVEEFRNGRWTESTVYPVIGDDGNVSKVAVFGKDITDRKNNEIQIRRITSELEQLNAQKDKFFSIIAHDLQSPFNAIMGFSELLAESIHEKDYPNAGNYAEIILQSSERAMALLINLLEWSRSQTGRMEYNPVLFDFRPFVEDVVLTQADAARQKQITLIVNIPDELKVSADRQMIGSVLRNLLSNAIKFSYPDSKVYLNAKRDRKEFLISVSDEGVGIQETELKKLFQLGEAFTSRGTHNEKGSGLGLVLCKEFVERNKGRLWAESIEGKGSTFYFTLPEVI